MDADLDRSDIAALALALAQYRTENAEQLDAMLEEEPWEKVAMFAACSRQCHTLRLKPWQVASCDIHDPDDPDDGRSPGRARHDGRYEAARLLCEMLDLGISRYHPDPLAAIEGAKLKARE